MQPDTPFITSPSFNSYSSAQLADIAARVVQEFSNDPSQVDHDFNLIFAPRDNDDHVEENEFEFAVVCADPGKSPVSMSPSYPLFNTALLLDKDELSSKSGSSTKTTPTSNTASRKPVRLSLRKLFNLETTASQQADGDDLENLPAETYCVWSPNSQKKKSSTGCSKRWKLRDLLNV